MPRKTIYGFNTSVNDTLGAAATYQQLMLQVNAPGQKKYLTGFNVNLVLPAASFPVGTSNLHSRVVIATGNIQEDDAGITILDMSPFSAGSGFPVIRGAGSILFDQAFTNSISREFTIPIEISEGDRVSILVGLPWADGDNAVTPDGGIAYLSWTGFVGGRETSFPFKLR